MIIWILQTGEPLRCDGKNIRPMRALNLSKILLERGHKVEIISTRFFHQKKLFRKSLATNVYLDGLKETLIDSIGYKSNVSLLRLLDHHLLSWNLLINLFARKERPDVLFVGYPPIEWSLVTIIYSIFKRIPLVLDVKDLWPDIFWDKENKNSIKKYLLKSFFYLIVAMQNF